MMTVACVGSVDWIQWLRRAALLTAAVALSACGGGGDGDDDDDDEQAAAPTITLAQPAGSSVNRTVTLTATPTAASGLTVSRVEFLVDGTVIANLTAAPFTTNWDTSTSADGAHQLTARVTDSNNQVATSAPVSVTVLNRPSIDVTLTPDETFPDPTSTASGTGTLTFNLVDGSVTGGIDLTGIVATLAHIHGGAAGTTGPIFVDFVRSNTNPNRWDVETGDALTADQVNALLKGELYVNVHSAAYPAGEIRGQLKPQDIEVAVAYMSGDEVSPPVTTTATGIAGATVNTSSNVATVHLTTSGVDDATAAHVHVGQLTVNTPTALLTLNQDASALGHWSVVEQPITANDRTSLSNGEWYADVHTPANPNGELRAQLTTDKTPTAPATVTLTQLQNTIFTPICSGCHTGGGGSLPSSMNLSSAAATHAAIVGVASEQRPSLNRVAPGDPDNSYLVHKIEGAAGIVGGRMPLGQTPLSNEQIANVRAWIAAGAQAN